MEKNMIKLNDSNNNMLLEMCYGVKFLTLFIEQFCILKCKIVLTT